MFGNGLTKGGPLSRLPIFLLGMFYGFWAVRYLLVFAIGWHLSGWWLVYRFQCDLASIRLSECLLADLSHFMG